MSALTSLTPSSSSSSLSASLSLRPWLASVVVSGPAALIAGSLAGCGAVDNPDDGALDCASITGVLACNNFEAEIAPWTKIETNGLTALDESDAVTGKRSLSAAVSATGGKAVRTRGIESVDRYYARFNAKLPAGSNTTGVALLHLGETSGTFLGTNVEISSGMLGVAVQSANLYEYPMAMPIDQWICLELDLVVSETAGRAILRANGTAIFDRSAIDTRPTGAIGDLEVGISYAGAAGAKALIDDVVVAREPLAACK